MVKRLSTYKFRHTAVFGVTDSSENELTGISDGFKEIAKVHYAKKKITISDRFQAQGTQYQDVTIIVIRHNALLASQTELQVKIGSDTYDVVSYSADDDDYRSYDMLTIKNVKKV